jgi:hypothetical protein
MKIAVAGQLLRMTGLLLEVIGAVGILSGKPEFRVSLPSGGTLAPAWIVVAIGFVLWMIGTALFYGSRAQARRVRDQSDHDSGA